jgi:predicted oxidoreductase (fatty acid repression mutant protein)
MTNTLIESIKKRRSQYALGKTLPISQEETTKLHCAKSFLPTRLNRPKSASTALPPAPAPFSFSKTRTS